MDERKKIKSTTFYSLCNYCMTHIMAHTFQSDSVLQSRLLSLCHCLWACMKTTLLLHSNKAGAFVVQLYTSIYLRARTCFKRQACHTLINKTQSEGFLKRVEFLTWKLALNPICTGRHIFGQSSAAADRENEPSILYNVA